MIDLPPVPVNLSAWLGLLMLVLTFIGGARKFLVNPVLKGLQDHADEHAEAKRVREIVLRELAPNGSEHALPAELHGKPLRDIAIQNLLALKTVELKVDGHIEAAKQQLTRINQDRAERGLDPLRGEDG